MIIVVICSRLVWWLFYVLFDSNNPNNPNRETKRRTPRPYFADYLTHHMSRYLTNLMLIWWLFDAYWMITVSRGETHVFVHCTFINLMKIPDEETLIFLVPASNHFMFWCCSCDERMYLWWIMIIRHKIWYVHINIYMRINMLNI